MGACNKKPGESPITTLVAVSPRKSSIVGKIEPVKPKPKEPPTIVAPLKARVSLQNVGQSQTDTINSLPPVFYVIIGRGPASVINHTTLLQGDFGKNRIKGLPVLHIGFRNPWSWYFTHGMGQPNYLLSLPGFHEGNQPGQGDCNGMKDEGLMSSVFGGCVDREMDWCVEQERARWVAGTERYAPYDWPVMNGSVVWIQKQGGASQPGNAELIAAEKGGDKILEAVVKALEEPYPKFEVDVAPYRLAVLRPAGEDEVAVDLVYARYIDICTGSGRPRQVNKEAAYADARLEPWRDPASWPSKPAGKRKIAVAAEAVRKEFDWPVNQRICIANGGAIALNAAERSRDEKAWADWFHGTSLLGEPPTFANPRNFSFLRAKTVNRPRKPNEGKPIVEADLISADARVRMGSFAQIKSLTDTCVVVLEQGKTRAEPNKPLPPPLPPPHLRDYYNSNVSITGTGAWETSPTYAEKYKAARGEDLPSTSYDYVVLHTGLDMAQLGQPGTLLAEKPGAKNNPQGILHAYATGDELIRILGAAGQSMPGALAALTAYRGTLPISAVPDGFILAGMTIASANQFFTPASSNQNVNTMNALEIDAALKKAGIDDDLLRKNLTDVIFKIRNGSNGFGDPDMLIGLIADEMVRSTTNKAQQIDRINREEREKIEGAEKHPEVFQGDGLNEHIALVGKNAEAERKLWNESEEFMLKRLIESAELDLQLKRGHELKQAFAYSYGTTD